ncbi:YobA family protein [Alkalihalobacillus oceani]|uniref:YobA family protein n=1 Tax=Halalkalibacter oceani TaxID=1653776 RepID=A0A9X2DMB9_9BACI|nr:YobA family protein [Halalkalibacter oceani]MCM3712620.1 YobA family protein [Halalkalibacter oceani]
MLSFALFKNHVTGSLEKTVNFNGGDFEGYAVKTEGNRLLLTNYLDGDSSGVWLSSQEPVPIELGQYVRVWFKNGQALGTQPLRAELDRFEVVTIAPPGHSDLTEIEAIQKALNQIEDDKHMQVPAIKSIIFHEEDKRWSIEMLSMYNDDLITIKVDET